MFSRRADELPQHQNPPRHVVAVCALAPFLLFVLASVPRAFGQVGSADEQKNIVRGTVINSVTQAPVPRALVFSPDQRFAMFTDSEGHFEFILPKTKGENENTNAMTGFSGPGPSFSYSAAMNLFRPMARKPGFLDDPTGSQISEPSTSDDLIISLVPESLIKGRVSLNTNDPAVGIFVEIFTRETREGRPRWTAAGTTRTNLAGEFRFAELARGTYKLATREFMDNDPAATLPGDPLYGFPPVYYPGAADFTAASKIELGTGQTVELDLSLVNQPYYPVKIPVINSDISGGVNVSVQGQRGPGYSLGYNGSEHRIEVTLPNGTYVVEGSTYGAESATGIVNLNVKGGPTEGPPMTLVRNSSINLDVKEEFSDNTWNGSGTMTTNKGTFSIHGARLYLRPVLVPADDFAQPLGGSTRPPTGPNDDSMGFVNVKPGKYWLELSSSRGYVASATIGGLDLLHEPFVVGSGATISVEVKLRDDCAEIDGTVTSIADRSAMLAGPVPAGRSTEAWVYLVPLPDSPGQFQQLGASNDGKFSYTMMAPGSYRVLAFSTRQPNLPYHDAEGMKVYETKGPVVHLTSGQKATVQVQLISGTD